MHPGLERLLSVVAVGALALAAGSALAAGNWYGIWTAFAVDMDLAASRDAISAQERWQWWATTSLASLVVAVACLAGVALPRRAVAADDHGTALRR
ncbi:hypothetical protein [Thalassiella azotivora]